MNDVSGFKTEDEKIKAFVIEAKRLIKNKGLKPNRQGDWFSNNQLDALRHVLEKRGINVVLLFQAGKIDRRGKHFDLIKNEILLDLLKYINRDNLSIDLRIGSYMIGKLNFLVREIEKEDLK